jgi:hypothetical protein
MYTRVIQKSVIADWVVPLLVWFVVLVIFLSLVAAVVKPSG